MTERRFDFIDILFICAATGIAFGVGIYYSLVACSVPKQHAHTAGLFVFLMFCIFGLVMALRTLGLDPAQVFLSFSLLAAIVLAVVAVE